jgi:dipeptidase E
LYLIKDNLSEAEIKNKILNSDIIYVGGGNTLKMMNIWRKNNLDKILKLAVKRGIVLSGISAGSICWFKSGLSDSRKFTGKNDKFDFIKVSGLDFVDALHCPHYDAEPERRVALKKIMKKTSGVAIAIDNGCALQILDDKYRLIKSKKTARAFRVFWFKGRFICETINLEKNFKLLKNLVTKFS